MEPLSSLSVASSAIQIFDFSSKLWQQIRELYQSESGSTGAQQALLSDAEMLCSLNSGLSRLLAPENLQRLPTSIEKDVNSLCIECDDAAKSLVNALQQLTISRESKDEIDVSTDHDPDVRKRKASQPFTERTHKRMAPLKRKFDAARIAIKGVWMKKDIDRLYERVEALKHSLAAAILVNIQHGIVRLDRKVDLLEDKWENVNSFEDMLRSPNFRLDTPTNNAKLMELLKAHEEYASRTKFTSMNDATEISIPEAVRLGIAKLEPWSAKSHHVVQSLMKSLSFSDIYQRQDSIHENYEGTFQWIYKPPQDADLPWDSFSTWLTEGRGIYWITGKAGSGKSTLMRMLHHNRRTHDLLRLWRSKTPLVTASFFFWNSGSKMQMSQYGFLQSILLQIMEQRLQQDDCDQLSDKLVAFSIMLLPSYEMRFKDLLQLFRLVIEDGQSSVKFFLLVDGLDESDGEKSTLISLVKTLGTYDNVKVCVSSRPWVVFEDGFRQQPSLILQHLTHRDILRYAKEHLEKEPSFRELSWADEMDASGLVRSITKKASGVFLWVVLAVSSLVKGLVDGDRPKDFEARLEELPEELEELFSKMLHKLEGRYFSDAARIFQIHRATRWTGFGGGTHSAGFRVKPSLLVYAFADEHGADQDAAFKWPCKTLTEKERFIVSARMRRRLNSRCNGLLEIDESATDSDDAATIRNRQLDSLLSKAEAGDQSVLPMIYSYGRRLANSNIQYLHRTVKDYLETPDIWRNIECAAPTGGEDYWILSLCMGHIRLWKSGDWENPKRQATVSPTLQSPTTPSSRAHSSLFSSDPSPEPIHGPVFLPQGTQSDEDRKEKSRLMLEECVELAMNFLQTSLQSHVRLLDAIGSAIFDRGIAEAECNQEQVLDSSIWSYLARGFVFEDFLALAVHLNLFAYVETKMSRLPPSTKVATASRLLLVAILKRKQWLCQRMTSLQENVDRSKWACAIDAESDMQEWKDFDLDDVDNPSVHMVRILMHHGANPDFMAYGTSARQILEVRRSNLGASELEGSEQPILNLLWIIWTRWG